MKKIVLTTLLVSSVIYLFGQNNLGIKIYQNTDIFKTQYYNYTDKETTKIENVNFNRATLAVDIETKKGYTHEIEFLIPEISKSLDHVQFPLNYEFRKGTTFRGTASSYSLRYELSKALTSNANRFVFLLGVAINPYYVFTEYKPNAEATYYTSTKLYGITMNMTPRIKYKLSHRFSIDLNIPLKVYDLRAERTRVENPSIPIRQQTSTNYSNIFLESAYTIRLGLMYKLTK